MNNPYCKRKNNRLPNFDYSTPTYYFITINTHKKQKLLSSLEDSKLKLTDLGEIVEKSIAYTNHHQAKIEYYVIMPDHIHLLIFLDKPNTSIPGVIHSLKSYTSKEVRERYGIKLWQKSYYDTVILNDERKENVIKYIKGNPYMCNIK